MNNLIRELLVEQIKERQITVRSLYSEISNLCENDPSKTWFSLATLERRLQNPSDITDDELCLIRDATHNVVSDSTWIHVKRHITEKMRYKYAAMIDNAVERGFALRQNIQDYDNHDDDMDFSLNILSFYRSAPVYIKTWWISNLETYLKLPDLTKASLLCSSYIGHSVKRNIQYNQKILHFFDCFPVFQDLNSMCQFNDDELLTLGNILKTASSVLEEDTIPEYYFDYARDKNNVSIKHEGCDVPETFEDAFCKLAVSYKHSITDYKTDAKDFIHECCFILYIDKIEWLLAFVTTIFFFRLKHNEDRYNMRREYHDRGCTGFKFTDKELDYLCELLYIIEK